MAFAPPSEHPGRSDSSPLDGKDRYQVHEVLGRGGMGIVYRVHDAVRGRAIALKRVTGRQDGPDTGASSLPDSHVTGASNMLDAPAPSERAITLFRREYHTLAQLAHPNIIEVYDYGVDAQGPYYTMELLDGHDLRMLAPLPWQRACAILRDVASALTLIHSRRLLHRDISPRNVYLTPNGRAKLIDFGTMTVMGVERLVAGTPPFVPPEAIARQSLDARADIYALGALAYFLLTSRNAYPARTLRQLQDTWRSQPQLPSTYAPDIPEALDALVMRMLSLDRHGRPSGAVELVDRLSSLAGLEHAHDQSVGVGAAYLSTPTLVGRDEALQSFRRTVLRAVGGRGASVWICGPQGLGHSRLLDACALEAKLAGALVVRLARGDVAGHAFSAARALFAQLHALLNEAEGPKRPKAALTWLKRAASSRGAAEQPGRAEAYTELLAYLEAIAAQRLVAIMVDDVQDIDEPSLALLASLRAHAADHRLVLACACQDGAPQLAPAAIEVLRAGSESLPLAPLDLAQTTELFSSVFGHVANVEPVAARVHALSGGRPLWCMELAGHLLERGVIRYHAGGFQLPERLSDDDLPASVADALQARVNALSEDARMLGGTLALAGSVPLTIEACFLLEEHDDEARTYHAAAELSGLQIVRFEGDHMRLAPGYDKLFERALSPARKAGLHTRLAHTLSREAVHCPRAALHFLCADQPGPAIDALLRYLADDIATLTWFGEYRAVFEQAIAACARLERPAIDALRLRLGLGRAMMMFIEPEANEPLRAMIHELFDLAGLGFWQQLDEPDPQQRLRQSFKLAQERFERTDVRARTLSPGEAVPALVLFMGLLGSYASAICDEELIFDTPTLEPYASLSPVVAWMHKIGCSLRALRREQTWSGLSLMVESLQEMDRIPLPNMTAGRREATRARLHYGVGMLQAALGIDSAEEHARAVEGSPEQRINAWRVRRLIHMYRPNAQRKEECRKQIELLQMQATSRQYSDGSTLESEVLGYSRTDDLLNLHRIRPDVVRRAERYRGWAIWLGYLDGELERVRGRMEQALACYEATLERCTPGRTLAWPHLAACQLDALVRLGRFERARELGQEYVSIARELGIDSWRSIALHLANAEAALGEHERAVARADEAVASMDYLSGVYLGFKHELRARVAITLRDAAGFAQYYDLCFEHYGRGQYPPLAARLERLRTEARRVHVLGRAAEPEEATLSAEHVRKVLAACNTNERASRALAIMLEATSAAAGFLYALRHGDAMLMAARSHTSATPELEAFLKQFFAHDQDDEHTVALEDLAARAPAEPQLSSFELGGMRFHPYALAGSQRGEVAAVVALAFHHDQRKPLSSAIASAIGQELLAGQEVTERA